MGQATVDLPDPLQNAGPVEAKSADDLLSQLAGDEIDRLLAETESDEPASPPSIPLSAPADRAPAAVVDTAPAVAVETVAAVDLDAVLETAVADRDAANADRAALNATIAPVRSVDRSPQIELGDPSRGLPMFLRPLEWLSAPLDPWPDQLREIIGKVGLLTLVNALAVLAYVLLFRRHHH